ncbi:tyrosine-type recombinase/integrase [Paraburkholderia bryophila]|uniref:Integrase n=1 Tax=Paraburkholderia bryophila TaxID=420952 RepID=A0A7Y9W254_9BURK|nr:tyrosine-type recombinase/integrase [Paraburkholderia bryophila]NYH12879.1 integrase [Paraburkholderia bryophila]
MLAEGELRALLPGIDKTIGRENGLTLRVLLATYVRINEPVMAWREFINLKCGSWFVQDKSVKTRQEFMVPLLPVVIGRMRELKAFAGDSLWQLSVRSNKRRNRLGDTHIGNTTLWAAITRAFEASKLEMRCLTPQDTRSTATSHMRDMGVSHEVSELAFNHKLKGMEGIYEAREEIPERRGARGLWAQFTADCCDKKESVIVWPSRALQLRKAK